MREAKILSELKDLPNIGDALARQLREAGIETPQQLRDAGSQGAWLRIQQNDPSACMNRLLALEGAVRGVKKAELPGDCREELRLFYRQHKLGGQ